MKECKEVCDKCETEFIKIPKQEDILKTVQCGYRQYIEETRHGNMYGPPDMETIGVECGDLCPECIDGLNKIVRLYLGIKE